MKGKYVLLNLKKKQNNIYHLVVMQLQKKHLYCLSYEKYCHPDITVHIP